MVAEKICVFVGTFECLIMIPTCRNCGNKAAVCSIIVVKAVIRNLTIVVFYYFFNMLTTYSTACCTSKKFLAVGAVVIYPSTSRVVIISGYGIADDANSGLYISAAHSVV